MISTPHTFSAIWPVRSRIPNFHDPFPQQSHKSSIIIEERMDQRRGSQGQKQRYITRIPYRARENVSPMRGSVDMICLRETLSHFLKKEGPWIGTAFHIMDANLLPYSNRAPAADAWQALYKERSKWWWGRSNRPLSTRPRNLRLPYLL